MGFSPDGRTVAAAHYLQNTIILYEVATGKERASLPLNNPTHPMMLAFSPDGRFLAVQSGEKSVTVWRMPACVGEPASPRSPADLWDILAGDDAAAAYRAEGQFVRAGQRTRSLFRDRLRPIVAPSADAVAEALKDLDSSHYAVREKAARQLEKLGESAGPSLRKALRDSPSLEVQRRVEGLLSRFAEGSAHHLRQQRAIEVLELIGDAPARDLLARLAAGMAEAALTRDARAALDRLAKRVAPP